MAVNCASKTISPARAGTLEKYKPRLLTCYRSIKELCARAGRWNSIFDYLTANKKGRWKIDQNVKVPFPVRIGLGGKSGEIDKISSKSQSSIAKPD